MHLRFEYLVLLAYWTVLVAELVGDRSIYTVSTLSIRFRPVIVMSTMALAFAGKMFAVVLLGRVIMRLNLQWTGLLSGGAFLLAAWLIWLDEPLDAGAIEPGQCSWLRASSICFGSLFFAEWGDTGQIAAAALAVKSGTWFAVWLGGTLAMFTKGVLAAFVGQKLRAHLPLRAMRTVACCSCSVLGLIALGGALFR
jgi:putative Ca2+/H+ antiporter (TMEM165/GDT1 family)